MSLKDLFKEQKNLKSAEPLSKNDFKQEIESFDYAKAINKRNARFVATEGFEDPANFARFGLAEKYYEDAITRIHDSYPYDGSLKEKVLWELSSSLVDLYIFENGYPRSTGYANFLVSAATSGEAGNFYPPVSNEYILVKGGPHAGTGDKLYYNQVTDEVVYRKDANVYDLSNNQENNLLIDGTKGNTVEFWLKKDAYVNGQEYFEFVLDTHVTGTNYSGTPDPNYGRLAVALATTGTFGNTNVKATATLEVIDAGGILDGETFVLTNFDGIATTYRFNAGVAFGSQPGGTAGGTVQLGFGGAGGGAAGKINIAAAIVDSIAATTDAGFTAVSDGVSKVTVTQAKPGAAGNKFNSHNVTEFEVSEFTGGTNGKPIFLSYASGSNNINTYIGATTLTTASIADGNWHHYAVRMKTTGSNTVFDLFVDGKHNDETSVATTIGYVPGAIVATLGSQASQFWDGSDNRGARGWSPLSGAIDEFRYWKRWRTSKQIQTRWFDQVGGGTNTDLSNTDLGVYFKFNEGITQTASVDSVVLDYSGRVSNGSWTGYSSLYSRETGSAILESSASTIEFKDPIIYDFHPDVSTFRTNMKLSGSIHDDGNVNCLKTFIPAWMLEDNETNQDDLKSNDLLNLLQIIAAYFDEAANLLKKLPQLSHSKYYKGDTSPPSFNKKGLESLGLTTPDIFIDSNLLERFEDRDDTIKFEKSLQEVKNIIYQNIYNNLSYIYKSKGTEKSIRNLLRCFGIGDNVLKINLYANEAVHKLEDNLKLISTAKNYINFNEKKANGISNDKANVFQYKIDDNATSFISGTQFTDGTFEGAGLSFTLESNVLLPNRVPQGEYSTVLDRYENQIANFYPIHQTSSLFGMHTARETENDLEWAADDFANFQVLTIKEDKFSSNAQFKLTGTADSFLAALPTLTSPFFNNAYNDQLWTISVTVEPTKIETINLVDGTSDSDYMVRFYGVNHIADYKANEFLLTGTITNDAGRKFMSRRKRVFVGAHRTDFTASVLQFADSKINSCKAWFASIPTGTIDKHNLKLGSFGAENPTQNSFLYQDSINTTFVPESQTLALLWNFSTVTASNASGQFNVEDESSGSANDNRYGWFSGLVSRRHTASGSFFIPSSKTVVDSIERTTYQSQVPEVMLDSNLTRILSQDDEFFDRNTRPTTYHLSIEKNLFQDISEEMLNMFGSVVWFNNMIGAPVNMYRGEYKELKRAADLFFEKVGNDYDFDKYVEYFKFIDYAVSRYLVKLIPASMLAHEDGISTIIENFVLGDRNKFRHKLPIIKQITIEPESNTPIAFNAMMVAPPAPGFSDNIQYADLDAPVSNPNSYKHMQAPINDKQKTNAAYWNQRSERANPVISSGDTAVDANRQTLLDVINNNTNTKPPLLRNISTSQNYEADGNVFVNRRYGRVYSVRGINKQDVHGGAVSYENKKVGFWDSIRKRPTQSTPGEGALISIEPPDSNLEGFKDIDDNLNLNRGKRKFKFSTAIFIDGADKPSDVFKGDMVFPFSLYSSSLENNPAMTKARLFNSRMAIENIHHDSYGPYNEVPMQGPFTEKYVGGRAYRHVMSNFTPDNNPPDSSNERLEGWVISASADSLDLLNVSPHIPKSVYFREEYAKRPVNIKNIKQLTSSADTNDQFTDAFGVTKIGNYSQDYEIVMTNERSLNNRYLIKSEGDIASTSAGSTFVSGVIDFPIPRRDLTGSNKHVIVNRFSAPGDPATMAEGMLDVAAAEYSVYNALPFRNLSVRNPLQELYSDHTNQFGYFSDQFTVSSYELAGRTYPGGSSSVLLENYSGTGSFHKVNRNGRPSVTFSGSTSYADNSYKTVVKYDNWHVQHAIPQTDAQYAWITASLVSGYTGSALFDYESKGLDKGDFASSDLVFASASEVGLAYEGLAIFGYVGGQAIGSNGIEVPTDFVGLNSTTVDKISSNTNTLGETFFYNSNLDYAYQGGLRHPADLSTPQALPVLNIPSKLNGILSHRGGPAGGSNWKLYKKDYHPIVRHQKEHNQIGYLKLNSATSDPTITNFTEPPITSKYKPLKFTFKDQSGSLVNVLVGLGNLRNHFTDHTAESELSPEYSFKHLDNALPTDYTRHTMKLLTYDPYCAMKNYLDSKNLRPATEVTYAETIYPKALYTYLSGTRKRLNFRNDFWRENRDNRNANSSVNSMGETIETSSIWKLDAHIGFTENTNNIPYSGGMTQKDGVGELQNCYSLFHYGTASNIAPGVNYNRRIKLIHQKRTEVQSRAGSSAFSDARENIDVTIMPSFSGLSVSPTPARFSASVGDTQWQASSSDNYRPFYDTYDEYAEEGFRNLKDGTILPEFRISEKMNEYVNANRQINYNNYNPNGFFTAFLNENGSSNLKIETGLLSLTGGAAFNTTEEFLNRYAFSDFYDYFKLVEEDYEDKTIKNDPSALMATAGTVEGTIHKLSCEAILKFLPYNGFYPAERATQLGTLFSESIASTTTLEGSEANFRTLVQPFFAPGILFNSIKSGIAVDYPIFDSAFESTNDIVWGHSIAGSFNKRLSFNELIEPQVNKIIDAEVDPDLALQSTASYNFTSNPKHTFAMSNFLAETMNLFIGKQSSEQSMIVQAGETVQDHAVVIPRSGTYSFDLHLVNSKNIVNYSDFGIAQFSMQTAPLSSSNPAGIVKLTSSLQVNNPSITMYDRGITGFNIDPFLYGSSFGPPVTAGQFGMREDNAVTSGTGFKGLGVSGSSFDPFTPPYYNGFSTVRVSLDINPVNYAGGAITREEIFASASYRYDRLTTLLYPVSSSEKSTFIAAAASAFETASLEPNFKHRMQVSASLFLGDENPHQVIYEREAKINPDLRSSDVETRQIVAFKPRWECPVLDFTNVDPTKSYVSGNVAKGMWHQYGEIPSSGDGIFMRLEPGTNAGNLDMLQLLNISPNQTSKIGKISSGNNNSPAKVAATFSKLTKKEFAEAIIAIPFKYNKTLEETELYPINKSQADLIKDNLYRDNSSRFDALSSFNIRTFDQIQQDLSPTNNDPNPLLSTSKELYNLMLLMRKYVIPPHLDFLHNDNIDPFVMFMIEYSINLSSKDLQNIWQNVEPTFSRKALRVNSESNIHLMPTTNEMFNSRSIYFKETLFDPEVTRWAVFKVKKRGAANYNSIVGKIVHNHHEYIRKDLKGKTDDFLYSYNWPHDFFSLIELAKINSITTFNPIYSKEKDE